MPPQNEQKEAQKCFQAENISPGHIFWTAVIAPIIEPN